MRLVRRLGRKLQIRKALSYALIYMMLTIGPGQQLNATPTGAEVAAGTASVTQSGNTTNVTVGSSRTVINWGSLDTSKYETLEFGKESGRFTVLNRVVEGGATQFDGSLLANKGHIIIVNPHGIVFGPTAFINAFKLTASALNISDGDFMNGVMRFAGGEGPVINKGEIIGEQVALIGKSILNAGTIRSPGGLVVMAAGESVYLGQEGSDVVVETTMTNPAEHTVTNNGVIGGDKVGIKEGKTGIKCDGDGPAVILAAGDIFSAALKGIESLRAEAKRDVTLDHVSAHSFIDVEAGRDIVNKGGLEAGPASPSGYAGASSPTRDRASIRIKSRGGDVTTGYLNARGRSEATVTVTAADDVTIKGDRCNGAVSARANNVPNADEATAKVCIEAGDTINIEYGVEAKAHGKRASTADIHIHGGSDDSAGNTGDITINTHNGWIKAWAETSGGGYDFPVHGGGKSARADKSGGVKPSLGQDNKPNGTAEAGVMIHTPGDISIQRNGEGAAVIARAKVADGGLAYVTSNGEDGVEEKTDKGAHAKIDIQRGYRGDCPGCETANTTTSGTTTTTSGTTTTTSGTTTTTSDTTTTTNDTTTTTSDTTTTTNDTTTTTNDTTTTTNDTTTTTNDTTTTTSETTTTTNDTTTTTSETTTTTSETTTTTNDTTTTTSETTTTTNDTTTTTSETTTTTSDTTTTTSETTTTTSAVRSTDIGAAPIQLPELEFTGCPALMNWLAKELGVEAEQIGIYIESVAARSKDIQPCEACARLKNTALVLMDADGAQIRALAGVVEEFAPAGAPPSEEQMALIAAAMRQPDEGTKYSLAAQWLEALAEYVNILHKDLGLPADETMAFAAKYTAPVTGSNNTAMTAYVAARLAELGG